MAQSASLERVVLRKPEPYRPHLSTTVFPRTQSGGTSLENHSQTGYPQSLFSIKPGFENISGIQFFEMGTTKLYS